MEPFVHIEKATAADFQSIADIYNEHIALGNATMDETPKQAHDIAQWEADFNDREGLFVLKGSRRVLGWGIIKRYSDREGYRFACETRPPFRQLLTCLSTHTRVSALLHRSIGSPLS